MQADVADMRRRIRAESRSTDAFKHGPGGLVDIDFVAQLGVLANAHEHPVLLEHTGTRAILRELANCGWIEARQASVMVDTHQSLAQARQLASLVRQSPANPPDCRASWAICRKYVE